MQKNGLITGNKFIGSDAEKTKYLVSMYMDISSEFSNNYLKNASVYFSSPSRDNRVINNFFKNSWFASIVHRPQIDYEVNEKYVGEYYFISGNIIDSNYISIELISMRRANIEKNTITAKDSGIYFYKNKDIEVKNNFLTNIGKGESLWGWAEDARNYIQLDIDNNDISIIDNLFFRQDGNAETAIRIWPEDNNNIVIEDNEGEELFTTFIKN